MVCKLPLRSITALFFEKLVNLVVLEQGRSKMIHRVNELKKMFINFAIRRLRRGRLDNNQILKGFIDGNGWLFSQPKTGTNLIASCLAFYNAELLGLRNYGFDDRYSLGVIHGGYIVRDAAGLTEALKYQRMSTRMPIIRWHDYVPDVRPECVICTTRNVLDQLASLWHYKYRARSVTVEAAIPKMVSLFAVRNRWQTAAIRDSERSCIVDYDDLIRNPDTTMSAIVLSCYGEINEAALSIAIKRSSKSEFKKWESARGKPAISTELARFEDSFIRSGEIGEGAEFFSPQQKAFIEKLIEIEGIDISGRIKAGLSNLHV